MDNIIKSASEGAQFTVFGDTYHGAVPMFPMYERMEDMKGQGQEYYFIEQHYSLQPAIEQLSRGEITEDQFREINGAYNADDWWEHSEVADSIIAATNAGLRVVAFDTRSAEELGVVVPEHGIGNPEWENPPNQIPGYPEDLLPAVQAAYDSRGAVSFDKRSADIVSTVAGEDKGIVWIGNNHIHGGHGAGDEKDFDGHLGADRTARVTVYYDTEQMDEYLSGKTTTTEGLSCVAVDQPDFVYSVTEDAELATSSAMTKGYDTSNLITVDIPAPCYTTEEPRVISNPYAAPEVTPEVAP